mmetsp:Transcript_13738/g.23401  ORF Transcript_13738/g.23401 Transcript_13738/m.23401 type:complete len:453 (-) Transcript_13738:634-1992(-)
MDSRNAPWIQNDRLSSILSKVCVDATQNVKYVELQDLIQECKFGQDPWSVENASSSFRLDEIPVGWQQDSGRCWMFSGLNVIRRKMIQQYPHLGPNFELSQSYLVYFEKLEKSVAFLNDVYSTAHLELSHPLVQYLFRIGPIRDGSDWHVFRELVLTYGIVPKDVMDDTPNTRNTRLLCTILNKRMVEHGLHLRKLKAQREDCEAYLEQAIYELVCILNAVLGLPMKSFTWNDQSWTPLEFYNNYVQKACDLSQKVGLIHNPTQPLNRVYTTQHGKNMACLGPKQKCIKWLNVPMDVIVNLSVRSLVERNEGIWFGCDVSVPLQSDRQSGRLETDLFDLSKAIPASAWMTTVSSMTKEERILTKVGCSSHNMVITGVRWNTDSEPVLWRVENSWGDKVGDCGYINMSHEWFLEHVYAIVVDKSLLSADMGQCLDVEIEDMVVMPPDDLFSII